MRLCRFDDDRLGLVRDETILDVTGALEAIPTARWPVPQGDPLIAHLDAVQERVEALAANAEARPLAGVTLKAPVAWAGANSSQPMSTVPAWMRGSPSISRAPAIQGSFCPRSTPDPAATT